jgi:hypothetical protein
MSAAGEQLAVPASGAVKVTVHTGVPADSTVTVPVGAPEVDGVTVTVKLAAVSAP